MARYLALLRGINVGGRNIIKMSDLRDCFEAAGYGNVATHIQSGNVLFDAGAGAASKLTADIERLLGKRFGYEASVVLRSRAQMRAVVDKAPEGFGSDSNKFGYNVVF